jgi:ribosome maturation factor RimP
VPSPHPSPHHERLLGALAPVVSDAGLVLEDVAVQSVGRRRLVRVVVDLPETEVGSVDLDRVAEVSRAVGAHLDETDAVGPGAYSLEVTTPGVDRPLTERRHWLRARTRLVAAERAGAGPVTGRLVDVTDDGPVLEVDGEPVPLPWDTVTRGLVQVEFTKAKASRTPRGAATPDGADTDEAEEDA